MRPTIADVLEAHPRLENLTRTLDTWEAAVSEGIPGPDLGKSWYWVFKPEINITSDLSGDEFDVVCRYVNTRLKELGGNDDGRIDERLYAIANENMPGAQEKYWSRTQH